MADPNAIKSRPATDEPELAESWGQVGSGDQGQCDRQQIDRVQAITLGGDPTAGGVHLAEVHRVAGGRQPCRGQRERGAQVQEGPPASGKHATRRSGLIPARHGDISRPVRSG